MFELLISLIISSLLCAVIIKFLDPLARAVDLVDVPSERKQHIGRVPLVGGISIYLSVCLVVGLSGSMPQWWPLFASGLVITCMGLFDDFRPIKPRYRLLVQISLSLVALLAFGIQILHIGNILGTGNVYLGPFSLVFTIACIIGVINSINMVDGVDGLAGSLTSISFAALGILALVNGQTGPALVLLTILGSLLGFLFFNISIFRPQAKIFLGDAGSNFLGFVLVWFFIELSQTSTPAFTAVSAGWLFGLPLVDTVSVMVLRLRDGKSPFEPGRDHLHHALQQAGLSKARTLVLMVVVHGIFVTIGILFSKSTSAEPVLFWLFVSLVILHHFYTPVAINKWIRSRQIPGPQETTIVHPARSPQETIKDKATEPEMS